MTNRGLTCCFVFMGLVLTSNADAQGWHDQPVNPSANYPKLRTAYVENGQYFTEDEIPTYNARRLPNSIEAKNSVLVDYPTYSGFMVYHSQCQSCHGPNGDGSPTAPRIKNSAVNMSYDDFLYVVAVGRSNGNSVMPSFDGSPNVVCYIDYIYVYLKARGMNAIPPGQPASYEPKSQAILDDERSCLGH